MKTIRVIILFAAALGQAVLVHAEFRAGIAVRIVTPDPLLPVSVSYTHLTLPTKA